MQSRKVFCGTFDGETVKKVSEEKCDASKKFNDTKNCTAEEECKGEWFAGPWSKVIIYQIICKINEFYGFDSEARSSRRIIQALLLYNFLTLAVRESPARCSRVPSVVEEIQYLRRLCNEPSKKRSPQISSINHLTMLQCSKPCGSGTMSRKVICMKDNVTVSTSACDPSTIMFSTEDCNDQPCEEGADLE